MTNKLLNYIRLGKDIKFYQSREWRKVRAEVIRESNNECQRCKRLGKVSPAECVHHIVHLQDNPLLGLTKSNLIALCNACHNIYHPEKLKKNQGAEKFINEERW